MKLKLLNCLCLLVISKIGYADIATPPSSCPSVGALKAADIIAYRLNDLWTFAIPENNFGTQQKWSFFLETADIKTEDANEALAEVKKIISHFSLFEGPKKLEDSIEDQWVCMYSNYPKMAIGAAMTPPMPFFPMLQTIKRLK